MDLNFPHACLLASSPRINGASIKLSGEVESVELVVRSVDSDHGQRRKRNELEGADEEDEITSSL